MKRPLSKQAVLAAVACAFALSCSEGPEPLAPPAGDPVFGVTRAGLTALQFSSPQRADSETCLVGADEGGSCSAGAFTLSWEAGAVAEDVEVTIRTPGGKIVQALLFPHGLQIDATVTVDLSNVSGDVSAIQGAYFGGAGALNSPNFNPLETFAVTLSGGSASWDITHFSGYCVASGYGCNCP